MFIVGENDSPFWMTLRICHQNHHTNLNRTPSQSVRRLCAPVAPCYPLTLLSSTSTPSRPATNAGPAPPPLPPCHCTNVPVALNLVVNVKQANNERRACAATVTTTMRPFVVASSVASPLFVDAKQADNDVGRACAAAAR